MLSVSARLPKINNSSGVLNDVALWVDAFTITFHVKLLNMGCKFAESLAVWYNSSSTVSLNGSSEETDQAQQKRNVFLNKNRGTLIFSSCSKFLSTEWPPSKNFCTASNPKWRARGSTPTALQTLNLPPMKSQKPKTLFGFIPNLEVYGMLVEQAQICFSATKAVSAIPSLAY